MARKKDPDKVYRLYDAALQLIKTHGFQSLTMAQVAKAAGVATGSIYTYFSGKEELINALYLHLKLEKMQNMLKVFDPEQSFIVNFKNLWRQYFLISLNEPDKMLFIEQYTYSPLLTDGTRVESDRLLTPLINLLAQAKADQLVKDMPPELMLQHLMGGTLDVVKFFINQQKQVSETEINHCFELTWSSIKK